MLMCLINVLFISKLKFIFILLENKINVKI